MSKKKLAATIAAGEVDVLIGTHALIQESLQFPDLALAVIDEQHRFGVRQRKALLDKCAVASGLAPHLLSMTATPIPRSLALALFGELDISIIDQLPQGRSPIATRVVTDNHRTEVYDFISQKIAAGQQAFVVCPLIDYSDKLGARSAKQEYDKLRTKVFPEARLAMLHGRMRPKEKNEVMAAFAAGDIDILVATAVVEVGVDVPNATIMVIEDADRFGLAQLHQFRGRVGRGREQSHCFLFSGDIGETAMNRLAAMEKHTDGFVLAQEDLKHRGPGEVYGTAQKGFPELKLASLFDFDLMERAKKTAESLLAEDADLKKWPKIREKFSHWEEDIHYE